MRFEKVYLVGDGRTACRCLKMIMKENNERVMGTIKAALGKAEKTNCVMPFGVIQKGIEKNDMDVIHDAPVILIAKKEKYCQLFYFFDESANMKDVASILKKLEGYDLIYGDVVTKDAFQYEGSIFQKLGLTPFKTYIRKNVENQHKKYRELMETVFAEESDLEEIFFVLQENFDVMSDHIPGRDELGSLIEEKNVLKLSAGNEVAGFLIFQDRGVQSYVRALCVASDYRGGAVGYSLLAGYFNRHEEGKTRLFYLWVDEANEAVKKMHDQFGYEEDGLKNYVFRRMRIEYGR